MGGTTIRGKSGFLSASPCRATPGCITRATVIVLDGGPPFALDKGACLRFN
jgi:hypothetical protein